MKRYSLPSGLLAVLGLAHTVTAAAVEVDWLQLSPGATSGSFQLRDDSSFNLVSGGMVIQRGVSFPGLPAARTIHPDFWDIAPDYQDSVTGDASIFGFEVRVVPSSGLASYDLVFSVPSDTPLVLMVGEMLRNNTSATSGVTVTATSTFSSALITYGGSFALNNTLKSYDQEVSWNGIDTLSTIVGNIGESEAAFLEIDPIAGPGATLRLSFPSAYSAGTGDAIFIGLGRIIPEPSAFALSLLGLAGLLRRRR